MASIHSPRKELDDSDFLGDSIIPPERLQIITVHPFEFSLPLCLTGGSAGREISITFSRIIQTPAKPNLPKTYLDYALVTPVSELNHGKQVVQRLIQSFLGGEELDRKDKILSCCNQLVKDDELRYLMSESDQFLRGIILVLARHDYLYNSAQQLLHAFTLEFNDAIAPKLEALRARILNFALAPLKHELTVAAEVDHAFVTNVDIIRQCCKNDPNSKLKVFEAGMAHLLLKRLAEGSVHEGVLRAALITLAQHETIKKRIISAATRAIYHHITIGWKHVLSPDHGLAIAPAEKPIVADVTPEEVSRRSRRITKTRTEQTFQRVAQELQKEEETYGAFRNVEDSKKTMRVKYASATVEGIRPPIETLFAPQELEAVDPSSTTELELAEDDSLFHFGTPPSSPLPSPRESPRTLESPRKESPRKESPRGFADDDVARRKSSGESKFSISGSPATRPHSSSRTRGIQRALQPLNRPTPLRRLPQSNSLYSLSTAIPVNPVTPSSASPPLSSSASPPPTPTGSSSPSNASSNSPPSSAQSTSPSVQVPPLSTPSSSSASGPTHTRVPSGGMSQRFSKSSITPRGSISSVSQTPPSPLRSSNSAHPASLTTLLKASSGSNPALNSQRSSLNGDEETFNVWNPVGLAQLVSKLEKERPSKTIEAQVTSALGNLSIVVLPNSQLGVWDEERNDEREDPDGVNDVILLTLLFSDSLPSNLLLQMTQKQLYYYLIPILKFKGLVARNVLLTLQHMVNLSPEAARAFFFLQRVTKFVARPGLVTWRTDPALQGTVRWLDETLVFSGKQKIKEGMSWTGLDLRDPLGVVEDRVTTVVIEKVYTSNAKPILLRLSDNIGNTSFQIFKRGDDLRQDMVVQMLFFLFNRLWLLSSMAHKPFIHQYRVVPMGSKIGTIEFVPDCVPSGDYNWKFLGDGPGSLSLDDKLEFILSMAGSYVACWVLGIRDRHQDNMMIHKNKIFIHIDFGFILNEQPGFDAPIFSVPRGVRKNLGADEWNFFLKICGDAFGVLHQHAGLIINMCSTVLEDLPMFSVAQVRKYLVGSLMVGLPEEEAKHKIRQFVISGSESAKKEMKYFMHDIAQKMK